MAPQAKNRLQNTGDKRQQIDYFHGARMSTVIHPRAAFLLGIKGDGMDFSRNPNLICPAPIKPLLAALLLFLCGSLGAKTYPYAAEDELKTGMKDKFGVGFETFEDTGALGLRYWLTDLLGLEGLLALSYGSDPRGTDASGNNVNNTRSLLGLGLGVKYNWKKPVEDVLVQFFARASFASGSTIDTTSGKAVSTNTNTLAVMAGTGFEAFLPVWRAISVEGLVGVSLVSSSSTSVNTALALNSSIVAVQGTGFTPVSLSIHYYF
jgi:hypothetical protein